MSKAWKWKKHERLHHIRPAHRVHAHRYADFHRAWAHGIGVPIRPQRHSHRNRRAKIIHRHRKIRDHGDPVFYTCRKFSHPRRRSATHDPLCHQHGGALAWRVGPRGRARLRIVRGGVRLKPGHGGCHWLHPIARDGEARFSEKLRGRHHHHLGHPGHPHSAVHRDGDLRRLDQHLGRQTLYGGRHPRPCTCDIARHHHVVSRTQVQLPAPRACHLARTPTRVAR